MKFMSETNTGGSNSNNWLGFSLSPHMKMEVVTSESQHHTPQQHHHHHQIPVSDSVPTSYYLSPPALNTSGMCFGVGENGVFSSTLSVMPLKSDGSLCIMEALSRSQTEGMVASSTPKLEDFLGGATMVGGSHHHYGGHEREAMPLSLDSMYYHQNTDSETNKHHSLDLLPVQAHHNFYSDMTSCHGFYDPSMEEQEEHRKQTQLGISHDHQIPHLGNGIPCYKTWAVSNQMNSSMVETNSSHNDNGGLNVGSEALSVGSMGCGDMQSLSLSMSPGSQSSSCITASQISGSECVVAMETTKKRGLAKVGQIQNQIQKQPVHRKSIDTFGQRTSQYRGVTRHRWTGRYEAHLWDNSCKKEGQTRKGRQVYLGGYDMEEKAARAYDLAALKYWGPSTHINFPLENYQQELEEMKNMSRQEYVAHLRRKSSGFSRGASMYRGVTRHHQHGRWQARIGRVAGNKDLYLGTFSTQEEAAEAYDIAAIKFRGVNAVTNFDITRYDVERIMASNTLLAGELARRNKEIEPNREVADRNISNVNIHQNHIQQQQQQQQPAECNDGGGTLDWKMVLYPTPQQQQPNNCMEPLEPKSIGAANNYRNSSFSTALQDLIGTESTNSSHGGMVDEANKMGNNQFSNPSSLVTSLSSSREDSPERGGGLGGGIGSGVGAAKPPLGIPKFISPSVPINGVSSTWFPSPQLRASAITSMSHLPVFAAWNDT